MSEDEEGTTNGSTPKLSIGQRILASLPNLERRQAPPPRPGRPSTDPEARESTDGGSPAGASDEEELAGAPSGEEELAGAPSGEAIEPDAVISPGGEQTASAARSGRMHDALLRPAPSSQSARKSDPISDMSNEELTHAIKQLDDRERYYALMAGPFGALIGIVLTIAAIHYNPPLHHKGHVANSVTELYGVARVVLGALVTIVARTRRRSLVAFALLFLGTAEGFPFALLFWGLGGWMIWRVFRYQKALTARGAGPRGAGPRAARATQSQRTSPRTAARSGASDARDRSSARTTASRERGRNERGRKRKQRELAGPAPSKRYTPPKPTRPRPPAASGS
jgi:hypothetical protein